MIRSGKECIWQVGMKTLEIEKCPRVVGRGSRRFLVQVGESKEKPWINKRCVCPGLRRFFRLESKQWRSTCDCTHKGRNDWNSNHEIAQLLLQPPFFQLLRVSWEFPGRKSPRSRRISNAKLREDFMSLGITFFMEKMALKNVSYVFKIIGIFFQTKQIRMNY